MPSTKDPDSPFVDWLLEVIAQRGWGMAQLAAQMGVDQSVVSGIVKRTRAVGPDSAKRLATALDISQYEIFQRAGLIDEELLNDDEAAKEYLRLLAAIEDDDERERAIDLVETLLRRMAEERDGSRKASRPKPAGRSRPARSEA